MNVLLTAAQEVCEFMASCGWDFCIIGGLAVQRWGRPRTTLDVDLTLLTGWGTEEAYVTTLLDRFQSRISDGQDFALARRILLLRATNGRDVDIALGALPFEHDMIRRAFRVEFAPGLRLPCCTPEDLFVMKAFAGRERDWLDAESIVTRQPNLDNSYILAHLSELCELKDSPETVEHATALLRGQP